MAVEPLITELRADLNQFRREMREAVRISQQSSNRMEQNFQSVNRQASQLGNIVGSARRQILQFGAAFLSIQTALRGFQFATRTITNFESAIASVRAVTRASESDMRLLTATARELGATTVFSASQAASGMEFLGRAG